HLPNVSNPPIEVDPRVHHFDESRVGFTLDPIAARQRNNWRVQQMVRPQSWVLADRAQPDRGGQDFGIDAARLQCEHAFIDGLEALELRLWREAMCANIVQ